MWEAIVPPGSGPPPHIHSREEESFFVLEGEITIQVGDERFVAKAGTFANMPVGSLHSFKNETDKNARMIISDCTGRLGKHVLRSWSTTGTGWDGTATIEGGNREAVGCRSKIRRRDQIAVESSHCGQ